MPSFALFPLLNIPDPYMVKMTYQHTQCNHMIQEIMWFGNLPMLQTCNDFTIFKEKTYKM